MRLYTGNPSGLLKRGPLFLSYCAMTDFERVSALLAAQTWTFAKTMPHNPHEYSVRKNWANDDDFVFVVQYIRDNGYTGQFEGRTYTYLNVNGYFYWTMGASINKADGSPLTIIINRKPLNAQ